MCIRPSVRPSLCRSVEKVSGSFWNYWLIPFIPCIYPLWGEFLDPIHFRVPTPNFCPVMATYLPENGVSELVEAIIGLIQLIPWHSSWSGEYLDLYSFSSSYHQLQLWWSNTCRKRWFPGIFCSITLQWAKWCRKFSESKVFQKYPTTTAK